MSDESGVEQNSSLEIEFDDEVVDRTKLERDITAGLSVVIDYIKARAKEKYGFIPSITTEAKKKLCTLADELFKAVLEVIIDEIHEKNDFLQGITGRAKRIDEVYFSYIAEKVKSKILV